MDAFKHLLNDGASEGELAEAERHLGQPLPLEWREIYRKHNGEKKGAGVLGGLSWSPLAEMVSHWRGWKELEADFQEEDGHFSEPPGAVQECYIHSGWIPFAHDHAGNHLGIDLAPGPRGRQGQIICFGRDQEVKRVLFPSAHEFWRSVAEAFRAGRVPDLLAEAEDSSSLAEDWPEGLSPRWRELVDKPREFLKSRQLYLIKKGLSDLEGLRGCLNLLELSIAKNEVRELTPLARLKNLRELIANDNPIEDLSPLAGLRQLRKLSLSGTRVRDLAPLGKLEQLKELDLSDTLVTDLAGLPCGLQELSLPEGVQDYAILGQLPKLRTLGLVGVPAGLKEWKGVRELTIRVRPGDELTALAGLKKVQSLRLHGAVTSDFLSGMDGLRELSLHHCNLPDLDALKGKTRFTNLLARDSEVANLDGLLECPALKKVTVSFDHFFYLKDRLKADFSSICGPMSERQEDLWMAYLDSAEP